MKPIISEHLESRRLLTSWAALTSGGVLNVRGNANNNAIVVSHSGNSIIVEMDALTRRFSADDVVAVSVLGNDGDDHIEMHAGLPSTLSGGDGDDILVGGPGPDYFRGGAGENELHPNTADDVIDFSDRTSVTLQSDLTQSLGFGLADDIGHSIIVSTTPFEILGTSGDDHITIDSTDEAIANITVNGGSGNDSIDIDKYQNTLSSNTPPDEPLVVVGGSGNDSIYIDSDAPSSTTAFGGSGNDDFVLGQMQVAANPTALDGGPGQDTLDLSAFDSDSIHAPVYYVGPGIEDAIGSSQDSDFTLVGNDLDNQIIVQNQATIQGLAGDDLIACQDRADCVLSGGKGNDTLISGNDTPFITPTQNDGNTLVGGTGDDSADYSRALNIQYDDLTGNRFTGFTFNAVTAAQAISLDNMANDGAVGQDDNVKSDIETILGGSGNDRLIGDSTDNYIAGNDGADTIYGGDGSDTLVGGGGKDHLYGEAGDDLLEARHGSKDFLDGGDGNDSASYDSGIDSVVNVETFIP